MRKFSRPLVGGDWRQWKEERDVSGAKMPIESVRCGQVRDIVSDWKSTACPIL